MKNIDKIPIKIPTIIEAMKSHYDENKINILKSALELKKSLKQETLYIQMYDMKMNLNYDDLYEKIKTFINKN